MEELKIFFKSKSAIKHVRSVKAAGEGYSQILSDMGMCRCEGYGFQAV